MANAITESPNGHKKWTQGLAQEITELELQD
jgi:hypothetical protein